MRSAALANGETQGRACLIDSFDQRPAAPRNAVGLMPVACLNARVK
jgi:hypothetical protein